VEGALPAEKQSALDEHLAACPRCAEEMEEIRESLTLLEQRELPDPGEAYWASLRRDVSAGLARGRRPACRPALIPLRAWAPAAAALVLLAALVFWWANQPRTGSPEGRRYLAQVEEEGKRSLVGIGQDPASAEELRLTLTPGDSLAVMLADLTGTRGLLERAMLRESVIEDPEIWDAVLSEESAAVQSLDELIEELTEAQLEELSARLERMLG